MDHQNEKCVMVIDEELPTGIIANTAGIMGITLGKNFPKQWGRMYPTGTEGPIWALSRFRFPS